MLLLSLFACAPDTTPTWAMDPIWIEPAGTEDVHGFQTWQLFGAKWSKRYDDKHYVCSIVVELDGAPDADEACRDCDLTWAVTPSILETDCADESLTEDAGFLALTRIGLGPVPAALEGDDPYPQQSAGAFADYGTGDWVPYGWGYPESLDNRGSADTSEWDGEQAFQLWPAYLWNLAGQ